MKKEIIKSNKTILAPALELEIKNLINEARNSVAVIVNAGITRLYWNIGKRIQVEILKRERADYGKQIVATLSRQLEIKYGGNYSEKNLRRMIQLYNTFPDSQIVATLSQQLSWSHFKELLSIEDNLRREFYTQN